MDSNIRQLYISAMMAAQHSWIAWIYLLVNFPLGKLTVYKGTVCARFKLCDYSLT